MSDYYVVRVVNADGKYNVEVCEDRPGRVIVETHEVEFNDKSAAVEYAHNFAATLDGTAAVEIAKEVPAVTVKIAFELSSNDPAYANFVQAYRDQMDGHEPTAEEMARFWGYSAYLAINRMTLAEVDYEMNETGFTDFNHDDNDCKAAGCKV